MVSCEEAGDEMRKQLLLSLQQVVLGLSAAAGGLSAGLSTGLTVVFFYVTHFLLAAAVQVGFPLDTVTPDGVILVSLSFILLLLVYKLLYVVVLLLGFILPRLWPLLKAAAAAFVALAALASLGLLLNDASVSAQTKAFRVVCLGGLCFLLSSRRWKDQTMAARLVQLEEQVKMLDGYLREMQRRRRG